MPVVSNTGRRAVAFSSIGIKWSKSSGRVVNSKSSAMPSPPQGLAKPWGGEGIADDFEFTTLPDDFDHFMPILEKATARLPVLETTGIQTFFNGPESFTPDDRYLLGEASPSR